MKPFPRGTFPCARATRDGSHTDGRTLEEFLDILFRLGEISPMRMSKAAWLDVADFTASIRGQFPLDGKVAIAATTSRHFR